MREGGEEEKDKQKYGWRNTAAKMANVTASPLYALVHTPCSHQLVPAPLWGRVAPELFLGLIQPSPRTCGGGGVVPCSARFSHFFAWALRVGPPNPSHTTRGTICRGWQTVGGGNHVPSSVSCVSLPGRSARAPRNHHILQRVQFAVDGKLLRGGNHVPSSVSCVALPGRSARAPKIQHMTTVRYLPWMVNSGGALSCIQGRFMPFTALPHRPRPPERDGTVRNGTERYGTVRNDEERY